MTKFGSDLIAALGEALVHAEGDKSGVVEHNVELNAMDVRAIRKALRERPVRAMGACDK